jgi:hypothetical protein
MRNWSKRVHHLADKRSIYASGGSALDKLPSIPQVSNPNLINTVTIMETKRVTNNVTLFVSRLVFLVHCMEDTRIFPKLRILLRTAMEQIGGGSYYALE